MGLAAYWRLVAATFVLAREGAFSLVEPGMVPPSARFGIGVMRLLERRSVRRTGRLERLRAGLDRLGPTYVKFGQTLATRPDIVGPVVARDLSALQDKMKPFDPALVPRILRDALGENALALEDMSPPLAAASIAQVHKARLRLPGGAHETVAVKLLRPGVKRRFLLDLESFFAWARLVQRFVGPARRLKPVEIIETLDRSARLELDLRLEAAAMSEFAQNIQPGDGFIVPTVHWDQTSETVLTTSWVDGIPMRDNAALDAAGVDRKVLARTLMQGFLKHAIRDGFFHADMHPGNLFADPRTNQVIAVDFGIMGRISKRERRFLADIIYGFITRDYPLTAQRHFDIGYVPKTKNVDDFALALRAVGEPLQGRTADAISMAKVLGQLFSTTELFEMQTRPELILLQKNMVLVEGVARALDPALDIWTLAEPVVGAWLRDEKGPKGRIRDLRANLEKAGETIGRLPHILENLEDLLDGAKRASKPTGRLLDALQWAGLLVSVLAAAVLMRLLIWGL